MTCAGPPFWTGSFTATADGTYVTDPVTLTVPGYYTYRESIAASDFVRAVETPCAAEPETTIVRGRPQIRTQVSAQEAAPGHGDHRHGRRERARRAERDRQRRAVRAVRDARRRSAATSRRSPTSALAVTGDGTLHVRADDADEGRLLHLPGVDRGDRRVRRRRRPPAATSPRRRSCGPSRRSRRSSRTPSCGPARRSPTASRVTGLGQTPGDDRGAAVRPVRVARGDRLRRHAAVEGHGRRRRRRRGATRRRSSSPRAGFYTYRERIVGDAERRRDARPRAARRPRRRWRRR